MSDVESRRQARLARYEELRRERPHLFMNPAGASPQILLDVDSQQRVSEACAAEYAERGLPVDSADIGVVYQDPWVQVVRDAVRFRSGREGSYVRIIGVSEGIGAAVMPVTDDGRVLLIHHFRHEHRDWLWEIPRGFGQPGATGAETARRELSEEVGVEPSELAYIGSMAADSAYDELYIAHVDAEQREALESRRREFDRDEGIDDIRLVTLAELEAMMSAGEIVDAYTLAAYAYAVVRGKLPG